MRERPVQYKARAAQRAEAYFFGRSLAHSHLGATETSSDFRSAPDRESTLSTASKRNAVMAGLLRASTVSTYTMKFLSHLAGYFIRPRRWRVEE